MTRLAMYARQTTIPPLGFEVAKVYTVLCDWLCIHTVVCVLFTVVQTHHQGVRLSREEIRAAEPIIGQLEITDWLEGNASGRAPRVARLKHPTINYYPELFYPLFDPVIVRMTSQGFLLVGVQIHTDEQLKPIETRQGWWVRCVPATT